MAEHEWTEVTDGDARFRRDYVCENCGHSRTVVSIPTFAVLAFVGFIALLTMLFPLTF